MSLEPSSLLIGMVMGAAFIGAIVGLTDLWERCRGR